MLKGRLLNVAAGTSSVSTPGARRVTAGGKLTQIARIAPQPSDLPDYMSGVKSTLMLGGRTVKQVLEMNGAGASSRSIASSLGISRNTVQKYWRVPAIPQAAPRPPRVSKLARYTDYVLTRVTAGIENCQALLRELPARGSRS